MHAVRTGLTSPPATDATPPEQLAPSRERYLMLTNGQLIKGILSETETECLVEQKVGTMHFPKKRVEGSFDSIREAYEYRLAQLPDRDSDERMKLALWCLNLKLIRRGPRAAHCDPRAEPQSSQGEGDAAVDRAGGDPACSPRARPGCSSDPDPRSRPGCSSNRRRADERPEALDSAILRNAQRGLGIRDLPVIFDLPLPLAIKRTEEFTRYVHPLLQAYCAKCHDGQIRRSVSARPDQVPGRSNAERPACQPGRDAATHRPQESVAQCAALEHAPAAWQRRQARPIFPGSNDKAYMVLARWVNHLAAPKESDATARREPSRARVGKRRGLRRRPESLERRATYRRASAPTPRCPPPRASTARTGAAAGVGQSETEPQEFPIPFAISGVKPNPAVPKKSSPPPAKQTAGAATSKAAASKTAAKPAIPADGDDDDPDDLPTAQAQRQKPATRSKPAKPFKLDPKLLERTLQYRNANRPNPN